MQYTDIAKSRDGTGPFKTCNMFTVNVQNVRLMQLPSTHISPIFRVCTTVVVRELHKTCLNNLVVLLRAAMTFEILAFSTLKIVQKRGHHSEIMEKLQFTYNNNKQKTHSCKDKF